MQMNDEIQIGSKVTWFQNDKQCFGTVREVHDTTYEIYMNACGCGGPFKQTKLKSEVTIVNHVTTLADII